MSLRRILFLLIALVASGSTIVVGRMWLQAERNARVVEAPAPVRPALAVLVAKGNLPAGTFIRAENLRWQPWPETGLAPSYVVEGKHRVEDYVGAVVRVGLSDGEPLTDIRVVRPGDRGFLAAVLTPGTRAVTVNVTPSTGLAGLVFPGDHIDLVGTFRVPEEGKAGGMNRFASETVLSNVRVLAVDQRVDDQNKEVVVAKTATLEVTPKQAEVLALVSELGKFSLSLRSLAQNNEPAPGSRGPSVTWDNEAARMLPPPNIAGGATKKVSVVRGTDSKDIEFPRSVR